MNELPHAMATGHIHSGTIAGKLNGVMPTVTPTLWRIVVTSTWVEAPSLWAPASRVGMPQANSTTSMPRCNSPAASERTLPCWALITAASSSARRMSASRKANSTALRLDNDVSRQPTCARRADSTTVSTSSLEASRTRAATSPRAGSNTSPKRSPLPAQRASSTQWSMVGSAVPVSLRSVSFTMMSLIVGSTARRIVSVSWSVAHRWAGVFGHRRRARR